MKGEANEKIIRSDANTIFLTSLSAVSTEKMLI